MYKLPLAALMLLAIAGAANAGDKPVSYQPTTIQEKYSYSLGYQFGSQVRGIVNADKEFFDQPAFMAAMRAALSAREPALSPSQMDAIRKLTLKAMRDKRKLLAQEQSDKGLEFRQQYAGRPGVKRLDSGVLYRQLQRGDGPAPNRQQQFLVHFEGRLIDGKIFASTYASGKAQSFSYDSIISGWQEVLPLMKPGSILEIVVPPELGYGERGLQAQGIAPNSTLQFKLELVQIL